MSQESNNGRKEEGKKGIVEMDEIKETEERLQRCDCKRGA
jgi:hypothetical protein